MIKQCIKSLLCSIGLEIRKIDEYAFLGYDLENEADELIRKIRPYTMLSRQRLISLYQQVFFCEQHKIPGCFIECGVWKGGAVALMALANIKNSTTPRIIHLFDIFQEICEPDASVDGERAVNEVKKWANGGSSGKLEPIQGVYDLFGGPGSLEENRELLEKNIGYNPMFLHYHKGWFQETLPRDIDGIGEIAILRLDGDWYASTKICLEYLYDKVVAGGFIIIDDYGAYEGCRKAVDEFLQGKGISVFLNHIDSEAKYWIKN
jgi:O-methyltransferase